ncbi:hypothetical protein, partial [Amycolatopsis circi]|uniref:hypothetical protein n=1 Tax=Amycolatopsis circi TaxID=871959 RepID=UPI001ABEF28E
AAWRVSGRDLLGWRVSRAGSAELANRLACWRGLAGLGEGSAGLAGFAGWFSGAGEPARVLARLGGSRGGICWAGGFRGPVRRNWRIGLRVAAAWRVSGRDLLGWRVSRAGSAELADRLAGLSG